MPSPLSNIPLSPELIEQLNRLPKDVPSIKLIEKDSPVLQDAESKEYDIPYEEYKDYFPEGQIPTDLSQKELDYQRAVNQGWGEQALRMFGTGLASGVLTTAEDLSYILDPTQSMIADMIKGDSSEINAVAAWARENREELIKKYPIYREHPEETFGTDSGSFFTFGREVLNSGLGFGLSGAAIGAATKGITNLAKLGKGITSFIGKSAEKLAQESMAASDAGNAILAKNLADRATNLASKAVTYGNDIEQFAAKAGGAIAMNLAEGKFMASDMFQQGVDQSMQEYDKKLGEGYTAELNKFLEDNAKVFAPGTEGKKSNEELQHEDYVRKNVQAIQDKYFGENAKKARDNYELQVRDTYGKKAADMMSANKYMAAQEFLMMRHFFKPAQGVARSIEKPLYKQLFNKGTSGKAWGELLRDSGVEGLEENIQSVMQSEIDYSARLALGRETPESKDKIDRLVGFSTSPQAILETAMGLFSSAPQTLITSAIGERMLGKTGREQRDKLISEQDKQEETNNEYFKKIGQISTNNTEIGKEEAFNNLAYDNFERGTTDRLIRTLETTKEMSPEEAQSLGYGEDYAEKADKKLKDIERLRKVYLANKYLYMPKLISQLEQVKEKDANGNEIAIDPEVKAKVANTAMKEYFVKSLQKEKLLEDNKKIEEGLAVEANKVYEQLTDSKLVDENIDKFKQVALNNVQIATNERLRESLFKERNNLLRARNNEIVALEQRRDDIINNYKQYKSQGFNPNIENTLQEQLKQVDEEIRIRKGSVATNINKENLAKANKLSEHISNLDEDIVELKKETERLTKDLSAYQAKKAASIDKDYINAFDKTSDLYKLAQEKATNSTAIKSLDKEMNNFKEFLTKTKDTIVKERNKKKAEELENNVKGTGKSEVNKEVKEQPDETPPDTTGNADKDAALLDKDLDRRHSVLDKRTPIKARKILTNKIKDGYTPNTDIDVEVAEEKKRLEKYGEKFDKTNNTNYPEKVDKYLEAYKKKLTENVNKVMDNVKKDNEELDEISAQLSDTKKLKLADNNVVPIIITKDGASIVNKEFNALGIDGDIRKGIFKNIQDRVTELSDKLDKWEKSNKREKKFTDARIQSARTVINNILGITNAELASLNTQEASYLVYSEKDPFNLVRTTHYLDGLDVTKVSFKIVGYEVEARQVKSVKELPDDKLYHPASKLGVLVLYDGNPLKDRHNKDVFLPISITSVDGKVSVLDRYVEREGIEYKPVDLSNTEILKKFNPGFVEGNTITPKGNEFITNLANMKSTYQKLFDKLGIADNISYEEFNKEFDVITLTSLGTRRSDRIDISEVEPITIEGFTDNEILVHDTTLVRYLVYNTDGEFVREVEYPTSLETKLSTMLNDKDEEGKLTTFQLLHDKPVEGTKAINTRYRLLTKSKEKWWAIGIDYKNTEVDTNELLFGKSAGNIGVFTKILIGEPISKEDADKATSDALFISTNPGSGYSVYFKVNEGKNSNIAVAFKYPGEKEFTKFRFDIADIKKSIPDGIDTKSFIDYINKRVSEFVANKPSDSKANKANMQESFVKRYLERPITIENIKYRFKKEDNQVPIGSTIQTVGRLYRNVTIKPIAIAAPKEEVKPDIPDIKPSSPLMQGLASGEVKIKGKENVVVKQTDIKEDKKDLTNAINNLEEIPFGMADNAVDNIVNTATKISSKENTAPSKVFPLEGKYYKNVQLYTPFFISKEKATQSYNYAKKEHDRMLGNTIGINRSNIIHNNISNKNITYGVFNRMCVTLLDKMPKGTVYHEAFHAVFRTFLSESEITEVLKEGKKRYARPLPKELLSWASEEAPTLFAAYNNNEADMLMLYDRYVEEKLAEEFRSYANKKKTLSGWIKDLFDQLLKYLGFVKDNFDTLEALYSNIYTGKYKGAEPKYNIYTDSTYGAEAIFKYYDTLRDKNVYTNAVESNRLINMVALKAMFTLDSDKNFIFRDPTDADIDNAIKEVREHYKESNWIGVAKLINPDKLKKLRADLLKKQLILAANNENNLNTIKDTIKKYAKTYKSFEVDPITEQSEEDRDGGMEDHIKSNHEKGGYESINKIMKIYLATVTIPTDEFELGIPSEALQEERFRLPIDPRKTHDLLTRVLADTNRNSLFDKVEALATDEPTIKAVWQRLSVDSKKSLNIKNLFENTYNKNRAVPYFLEKDINGKVKAYPSNYNNVENVQVSEWRRNWDNIVDKGNTDGLKGIVKEITRVFGKDPKEALPVIDEDITKLQKAFESLGISLSRGYLRYSIAAQHIDYINSPAQEGNYDNLSNIVRLFSEYKHLNEKSEEQNSFILELSQFIDRGKQYKDNLKTLYGDQGLLTRLKNIARANAVFDINVIPSTYTNADGKKVCDIVAPFFLSDAIRKFRSREFKSVVSEIRAGNLDAAKGLFGTLFNEFLDSPHILDSHFEYIKNIPLLKDPNFDLVFNDNFVLHLIDGFRRMDLDEGTTYAGAGERDSLILQMDLYAGGKKRFKSGTDANKEDTYVEFTEYILAQNEAKNTQYAVLLPIQELYKDGKATNKFIEDYYALIKNEYERISRVQKEINSYGDKGPTVVIRNYNVSNIEDGVEKGLKGVQFNEYLIKLKDGTNLYDYKGLKNKLETAAKKGEDISKFEEDIKEYIQELVKDRVKEHKDKLIYNNIIKDNGNAVELSTNARSEKKGKYILSNSYVKDKKLDEEALGNFVLNYMSLNAQFKTIVYGDKAMKSLKDAVDEVKRNGLVIAAGTSNKYDPHVAIVKGSKVYPTNDLSNLSDEEKTVFLSFDSEYKKLNNITAAINATRPKFEGFDKIWKSIAGKLRDSDRNDGQSFVNPAYYYHSYIKGLAKDNALVKAIYDKILRGRKITWKEFDTLKHNGALINERKWVYFDGHRSLKTSMHILTREVVSRKKDGVTDEMIDKAYDGLNNELNKFYTDQPSITKQELNKYYQDNILNLWEAVPGYEMLHDQLNQMETTGTDILSYDSAAKTMAEDISEVEYKDGVYNFNLVPHKYIGNYLREQMSTDKHSPSIVHGTQQMNRIWSEQDHTAPIKFMGKDVTIGDVVNFYKQLLGERIYDGIALKVKEVMDKDGNIDVEVLSEIFRENLELSGADPQMLYFVESVLQEGLQKYKFEHNLNYPFILNKIESMWNAFMSMGTLKHRVAGDKCTLVSDDGFGITRDKNDKVVRREQLQLEGNKEGYIKDRLRYAISVTEGDNKGRIYSECIIPANLAELYNLKPGDEIPEVLALRVGARIPTASQGYMVTLKVVDLLPAQYGYSIIMPAEVVMIAGEDFDIDSKYLRRKDYFVDSNTNIIEYGNYLKTGSIKDAINEVKNSNSVAVEADKLAKVVNDNIEAYETGKFDKLQPLTIGEANNLLLECEYILANNDTMKDKASEPDSRDLFKHYKKEFLKLGVKDPAIYRTTDAASDIVTAHSANQAGKNNIGIMAVTSSTFQYLATAGLELINNNVALFDKFNKFVFKNNNDVRVNKLINQFLSSALDNAKFQDAAYFNLSGNTLGEASIMLSLGIPEDVVLSMLQMDVIKEYSKAMDAFKSDNKTDEEMYKGSNAILDKLEVKYGGKLIPIWGENSKSSDVYKYLSDIIKYQNGITTDGITIKEDEYKRVQATVLGQFKLANKYNKYIRNLNSIMQLSKGVAPTFAEIATVDEALSAMNIGIRDTGKEGVKNRWELYNTNKNEGIPFNILSMVQKDKFLTALVKGYAQHKENSKKLFLLETNTGQAFINSITNNLKTTGDGKSVAIYENNQRKIRTHLISWLLNKAYLHKSYGKKGVKQPFNVGLMFNHDLQEKLDYLKGHPQYKDEPFLRNLDSITEDIEYSSVKRKLKLITPNIRVKGSPELANLMVDSYRSLSMDDTKLVLPNNKEIQVNKFLSELTKYLAVKDSFMYNRDSFIKYIDPTVFKGLSNILDDILGEFNQNNPKLEELFGMDYQGLAREFNELFFRHSLNNNLYPTPTKEVKKKIKVKKVDSKTGEVKEVDEEVYKVKLEYNQGKAVLKGEVEDLAKAGWGSVNNEGELIPLRYVILGNAKYMYIGKSKQKEPIYKKVSNIGHAKYSPYYFTTLEHDKYNEEVLSKEREEEIELPEAYMAYAMASKEKEEAGESLENYEAPKQTKVKPTKEVSTKASSAAETIYNKLGGKTLRNNVVIAPKGESIFGYFNRKFKVDNKGAIYAGRGKGGTNESDLINNLNKQNFIGNPFDWQDLVDAGIERSRAGKVTTMQFIDWLTGTGFTDVYQKYRSAILNKLPGLKGKKILYYDNKGYATHATALDYLINEYDWDKNVIDRYQYTSNLPSGEELKKDVNELVTKALNKLKSLPNEGKDYIIGFHGGPRYDVIDRKKQYTGEFRDENAKRIAESMGARYEGEMLFYTEDIEYIDEVVFKEGSGLENIPAKVVGTYNDAAKSALRYSLNYGNDTPTLYAYLIPKSVADYTNKGVGEVGVSYNDIEANKISRIDYITYNRKELNFKLQLTSNLPSIDVEAAVKISEKLMDKMGINYRFDNSLKSLGAFINSEVVLNPEMMRLDTPFHEFAHPFVYMVKKQNIKLYNKLVNELVTTDDGKRILNEVIKRYADKSTPEQIEEAITQAIGEYAANIELLSKKGGFWNAIKEMLVYINDRIKKLLGKKVVTPEELDPNTTLKELGILMQSSVRIKLSGLPSINRIQKVESTEGITDGTANTVTLESLREEGEEIKKHCNK